MKTRIGQQFNHHHDEDDAQNSFMIHDHDNLLLLFDHFKHYKQTEQFNIILIQTLIGISVKFKKLPRNCKSAI